MSQWNESGLAGIVFGTGPALAQAGETLVAVSSVLVELKWSLVFLVPVELKFSVVFLVLVELKWSLAFLVLVELKW